MNHRIVPKKKQIKATGLKKSASSEITSAITKTIPKTMRIEAIIMKYGSNVYITNELNILIREKKKK